MDGNMTETEFLKDYLNAHSPVGGEKEGQDIWCKFVEQYAKVRRDPYGTAVATLFGELEDLSDVEFGEEIEIPPKVVIEAHCDEIAWCVSYIESDGYIRVKRAGGSDNMIAASMPVIIHSHDGKKIPGVFGHPAVHTREKYTEMSPEVDSLWIDTGLPSKEAVLTAGVEVGCLITFNVPFYELGDYYVGKALDNKIGGYIIAMALKTLKEEECKLPYDLYVVNSVQEEVGLYGAKRIAKELQAQVAIVHDVTHNTSHPKMNKAKEGDIKGGEGPCLEFTAQNHRGLNSLIRGVAKSSGIPLQLAVGSFGNDTTAFFLENTTTAIIATPLKYMHTTVEMAHKKDVENCITLFVEFLKSLTREQIKEISSFK
jgi:putative aminopeptidase FrvX